MLRTTLLAEGPGDRALVPLLRWLLEKHWRSDFAEPQFAMTSTRNLSERIQSVVREYPCELLLVHRDADKPDRGTRERDIRDAAASAGVLRTPVVCLIPVRETEAWLLLEERAIRQAAGHPNGRRDLGLPPLSEIEATNQPKERLKKALVEAAELSGRRLKKFRLEVAVSRIAELMNPVLLRQLPAFVAFERELSASLTRIENFS